jgi:hypothetical protein
MSKHPLQRRSLPLVPNVRSGNPHSRGVPSREARAGAGKREASPTARSLFDRQFLVRFGSEADISVCMNNGPLSPRKQTFCGAAEIVS